MSLFTIFSGRPTTDPEMKQSKTGTEYISLDIAVPQYSPDGKENALFVQCYFHKSLADRLLKAKVMKGTCLQIRGDLKANAFVYQQGEKAGQAGLNLNCYVENWEFCLSNRQNSGQNPNQGQNGNYQPNGNNPGGNYPNNGGQNNRTPNGNGFGGSYAGNNNPQGSSANGRNMNGGYPRSAPGGVPTQANGYGNPNQTAEGGYGYNPNPEGSYYSEGFDGVPQEPLPYN
ncbi:single-stranded DNA-binding protein [Mordavella massiliensis]|uniref:Single-stranded DNA-binding protein n=1 Tax=Mordavella massiliensis TaxID=1871024 RepID=A0A938X5K2_9CLOT|nr:single-stranded DNA-binding protein [Mordavella massiliensis]MBM6827463.1 single-stranded DNA-binding protein [Mordavella massiliensis]